MSADIFGSRLFGKNQKWTVLIFITLFLLVFFQLRPTQSQTLICPEASKIKTPLQAIEYIKRKVIDVSDYVKRPHWQETFKSEAYRDVTPIGRLERGTGWLVGEIKDDIIHFFGVDFRYRGDLHDTAFFAEVNVCGHVRDSGFSLQTWTTKPPYWN